jgi:hypothetical protein
MLGRRQHQQTSIITDYLIKMFKYLKPFKKDQGRQIGSEAKHLLFLYIKINFRWFKFFYIKNEITKILEESMAELL